MAKYRITANDEVEGTVTYEVLVGAQVIFTDTRSDIPFEDAEAAKAILEKDALVHEAAFKAQRKADKEFTKLIGKVQTVEAPIETPVAPSEV